MNTDPIYPQKVVRSMIAARLARSLTKPFVDIASGATETGRSNGGGLNTAEAIALIHAMNSGNRGGGQSTDLSLLAASLPSQQNTRTRQATSLFQPSREVTSRQAPVPVPVPLPVPVPIPLAAAVAAFAAFAAAVLAGLTPFAAVFLAAAAALVAILAALLAILIVVAPKKNAPIVKKLVIKKTVMPFVIPIPIKKQEKKIIYKYYPKKEHHHHHEEHHEEHHYKKHKGKYKYKKSDEDVDSSLLETTTLLPNELGDLGQINKLDTVLSEQDRIQNLIDEVVQGDKTTDGGDPLPMAVKRSGSAIKTANNLRHVQSTPWKSLTG